MAQTPNASLAAGKVLLGNSSGVSRPEYANVAALDSASVRCTLFEDFLGKALNVTDSVWGTKDTSSAGTPTQAIVADAADGHFAMTFDNTNEAQILTLYWNDELNIDVDKGPVMEFRIKAPTIPAATTLVAGFAGAQNDTADSVAQNAWIRVENGTNILLESDDGTTDSDDKNSTVAWANNTFREFKIDMSSKTNILFYYRDTLGGSWTALTDGATTFTLAAYTAGVQPFIQWQKASGTGTEAVTLDYVKVYWTRS